MKIIFVIKILFFSTLEKFIVGGFVNQLIKKFWPNYHIGEQLWFKQACTVVQSCQPLLLTYIKYRSR